VLLCSLLVLCLQWASYIGCHFSCLVSSANVPLSEALPLQRHQVAAMHKHALPFGETNAQAFLTLNEELAGIIDPTDEKHAQGEQEQTLGMTRLHVSSARGQQQYYWRDFVAALATYNLEDNAAKLYPATVSVHAGSCARAVFPRHSLLTVACLCGCFCFPPCAPAGYHLSSMASCSGRRLFCCQRRRIVAGAQQAVCG